MNSKINKIIEYLTKLQGIGPRQATRLALDLASWNKMDLKDFGDALRDMRNGPIFCRQCFNFAENELCSVCSNPKRDKFKIAVVEKITDINAVEQTGIYDGVYHVLGGAISPSNGQNGLKISELIKRVHMLSNEPGITSDNIEIIAATSPNTYGETTAIYLTEKLKPLGVRVTRLAQGLSAGSSIEYSDEVTLSHALKHRR
ncbi:MAG: recombination protein RecR [Candidatus Yanofskybacteria bacterium CG10_big_fil_rev_8_21_14_0_10_36_16]|uniref:Recombination protein RecR n=1 Tax=Candidatus Yanofskybacteria bacterium CG10_big_fil_rev_8_21_14_0_10_36_16 TaxID=1975096 RepID=A0A2J0Q8B4_9BACT|nr:MAG: recombination protein RecR [Candidatus Yanofskybacteria bacterium CG10_big_fil_rev_8_21_14_0_10_36_16]